MMKASLQVAWIPCWAYCFGVRHFFCSVAAAFAPADSSAAALSQTYRDIAEATNQMRVWPDSRNFQKCLDRTADGRFVVPPTFHDGHGPIGVFAIMLWQNANARKILEPCVQAFDDFCSHVEHEIFTPKQWQQQCITILRSPEESLHVTVCMVHEHPRTLMHCHNEEEERQNWRPLSSEQEQSLLTNLSKYQSEHCVAPTLSLDSVVWTPDGAMIAGLVEKNHDNDDQRHYNSIKTSAKEIATTVLGGTPLTSRPKSLIHVTIGRIVHVDVTEDDHAQQQQKQRRRLVTELARDYNARILPELVASSSTNSDMNTFRLDRLCLARNVVWLMWEYHELGSWSLRDADKIEL